MTLLDDRSQNKWSCLGVSLLLHLIAIPGLILISVSIPTIRSSPATLHTTLVMPLAPAPRRIVVTPHPAPVAAPPKKFAPRIPVPPRIEATEHPEPPSIDMPPVQPLAREPILMSPRELSPPPPERAPVHTGVLGANTPPPKSALAERVESAGFGEAAGVPAHTSRPSELTAPAVGDFNSKNRTTSVRSAGAVTSDVFGAPQTPSGSRSRPDPGPTKSTAFGTAAAPRSPSADRGGVRSGGFKSREREAASHASTDPKLPLTKGVEILSKPKPDYTDEARRLNIQGEVWLSVVFEAAGTVRVLSVTRRLGHGLDELAVRAAERIRFNAAQRDGLPVDSAATVRIVFESAQ